MSNEQVKKPAKSKTKKTTASAEISEKAKTPKAATKPKAAPAAAKKAAPKTKATTKPAVAAKVPEVATARLHPTHAEISARAYGYFLERKGQHGFHEQDWFRAEQELLGIS